jgi:hypothetical protein
VGESADPTTKKEPSRLTKTIAPREGKAQELAALLQGHAAVQSGEEWRSPLVPRATARVLQAAREREQTAGLGRNRSERRGPAVGYRTGDEDGTRKTAEGILRVKVPQSRGVAEPPRSQRWGKLATTSDRLTTRLVERVVGGRSQRDIAAALAQSLGPCGRSKSALRTMTDTLSQE